MDAAMDTMEIDIDLGDDLEEAEAFQLPATEPAQTTTTQSSFAAQPSPAPEDAAVPNKIHLRGVDEFSTANIEAFATEYYADFKPSIEWIDDTSVNLVYEDPETAQQALIAFSTLDIGDASAIHHLQLREAKRLSTHPGTLLQVRMAVTTDRKKPRAREASRYYLLHPEEDPGMRRRSDNRRRRRRPSDDEVETFDASMYDDNPAPVAARKREESGAESGRSRRSHRSNYDRDRSASPGRGESESGYRRRSRDRRSGRDLLEGNRSKELFPQGAKAERNKSAAGSLKKDLFPLKSGTDADRTADLFSTKMSVPLVDGAADVPNGGNEESFPLRSDAMYEQQRKKQAQGFSIKGAAGASDDGRGFTIRGSSGQSKTIKELFPEKVGPNTGKELFGRSGKRNKASDLFG